ncbi:Protein CBG18813 [Caenorhabditis briggsae]|uniref:Bestrophin homolog n=1 Tax=Caenorhabditis briggsae TaxID=6238 RepID=A8XU61_CAEBR|nr:Protein CBG18813 [Caenorhabditis briggsae]CAP36186.2 Protein CBG18813 [Caenorhabditis briggsae]
MTVSYNLDVSSVSFFNFFRVLFRWRGSVWKSIWSELMIWLIFYYMVMVTYRFALDSEKREEVRKYIENLHENLDNCVPLTFMLAFFVTVIVDRWKNIFANIGFIENTALAIATLVRGTEPETVLTRRTIIRYLVLSQVLVFRDISLKVRRRFPNIDSIIKSGFLQEHEAVILEEIDCPYNKYWVPINWASAVLQKVFVEGKITAAPLFNAAWQEVKTFRSNMAILCNFDWVPIPLAYPQVIFVAVRFYFFMCLFTRQHLDMMDKRTTGMAIVDSTYDKFPEMRPDKFAEPAFAPFYPEDVIDSGADHALIGSAQSVTLADPSDQIDMMKVDINSPIVVGKTDSTTSTFRRRLSSAFGRRTRSHSVQHLGPEKLEPDTPFSQSMAPQRPYGPFELSNGFMSSGGFNHISSNGHLPKLEEEESTSVDSDATEVNTISPPSSHAPDPPTVPPQTTVTQPVFVVSRTISEDTLGPTSPTLPFNQTLENDNDGLGRMKF